MVEDDQDTRQQGKDPGIIDNFSPLRRDLRRCHGSMFNFGN